MTKKLNGSLSHRPWTDVEAAGLGSGTDAGKGKRTLLDKHSLLVLSKKLIHEHSGAWTDDDIRQRSRELTTKIAEIWPGPATTVAAAP